MATEEQTAFRQGSIRRFGQSPLDYVEKNYTIDTFAYLGNLTLSIYIAHFLEWIFKQHFLKNHMTVAEVEVCRQSNTTISDYLFDPRFDFDYVHRPTISALSNDKAPEALMALAREMEQRMQSEARYHDLRARIREERTGFFEGLELTLMDVGPAKGAISTMMALNVLHKYGLLGRTNIYLVDVSQEVLDANVTGSFPQYPDQLINEYFGSRQHYEMLVHNLRNAVPICRAIDDGLPLQDKSVDITIAAFLFHHIPDTAKRDAAKEILRLTREAFFLADEHFPAYEQYADLHENDTVPLAPEQTISCVDSLIRLFPEFNPIELRNIGKTHYTYWGMVGSNHF